MRQGTKSKIIDVPGFPLVYLQRIYVRPENRGNGTGSRILKRFLKRHRHHYIVLEAHPIPGVPGPTAASLARWYARFGFKKIVGTGYNLMFKPPVG